MLTCSACNSCSVVGAVYFVAEFSFFLLLSGVFLQPHLRTDFQHQRAPAERSDSDDGTAWLFAEDTDEAKSEAFAGQYQTELVRVFQNPIMWLLSLFVE